MRGEEQQLQWAVQALAQPAVVQAELFPPFVVVPEELALQFDDWYEFAITSVGASWSFDQRERLAALNRLLDGMSGPDEPELWTDADSLHHERWSEVRSAASAVLIAFGWPSGRPPLGRAFYGGPSDA